MLRLWRLPTHVAVLLVLLVLATTQAFVRPTHTYSSPVTSSTDTPSFPSPPSTASILPPALHAPVPPALALQWCDDGVFAVSHAVPAIIPTELRSIVAFYGCRLHTVTHIRTQLGPATILSISPSMIVAEIKGSPSTGWVAVHILDDASYEFTYDNIVFSVQTKIQIAFPSHYIPSVDQLVTFYPNYLVRGIYSVDFGPYKVGVLMETQSRLELRISAPFGTSQHGISAFLSRNEQGVPQTMAVVSPDMIPVGAVQPTAISSIQPAAYLSNETTTFTITGLGLDRVVKVVVCSSQCSIITRRTLPRAKKPLNNSSSTSTNTLFESEAEATVEEEAEEEGYAETETEAEAEAETETEVASKTEIKCVLPPCRACPCHICLVTARRADGAAAEASVLSIDAFRASPFGGWIGPTDDTNDGTSDSTNDSTSDRTSDRASDRTSDSTSGNDSDSATDAAATASATAAHGVPHSGATAAAKDAEMGARSHLGRSTRTKGRGRGRGRGGGRTRDRGRGRGKARGRPRTRGLTETTARVRARTEAGALSAGARIASTGGKPGSAGARAALCKASVTALLGGRRALWPEKDKESVIRSDLRGPLDTSSPHNNASSGSTSGDGNYDEKSARSSALDRGSVREEDVVGSATVDSTNHDLNGDDGDDDDDDSGDGGDDDDDEGSEEEEDDDDDDGSDSEEHDQDHDDPRDYDTLLYALVTDYSSWYPFYSFGPRLAFYPRIISHNHPTASSAVAWGDYLYRVTYAPGTFSKRFPLDIFWGPLRLKFHQIDNHGFSVLVPRCHPAPASEQLSCPGGLNSTLTATLAGVPAAYFLPPQASMGKIKRRLAPPLGPSLSPPLYHHLSPSTVECGDDVEIEASTHAPAAAAVDFVLFVPDNALQHALHTLAQAAADAADAVDATSAAAGGPLRQTQKVKSLLSGVTADSLAQAIAHVIPLPPRLTHTKPTTNSSSSSSSSSSATRTSGTAATAGSDGPASSSSSVRASDVTDVAIAALFSLPLTTDTLTLDTLSPETLPSAGEGTLPSNSYSPNSSSSSLKAFESARALAATDALSRASLPASLLSAAAAAIAAAAAASYHARPILLPSSVSTRLHMRVLPTEGICAPSLTDMFAFDTARSAVDALYTSHGRRLRVVRQPHLGARVGFVWRRPLPEREDVKEELVAQVLSVIATAVAEVQEGRLISLGTDAGASVLYFGILPRHRNQGPTPYELSTEINALVHDPNSVLRQRLPDLDPTIDVPRLPLYPCEPPPPPPPPAPPSSSSSSSIHALARTLTHTLRSALRTLGVSQGTDQRASSPLTKARLLTGGYDVSTRVSTRIRAPEPWEPVYRLSCAPGAGGASGPPFMLYLGCALGAVVVCVALAAAQYRFGCARRVCVCCCCCCGGRDSGRTRRRRGRGCGSCDGNDDDSSSSSSSGSNSCCWCCRGGDGAGAVGAGVGVAGGGVHGKDDDEEEDQLPQMYNANSSYYYFD